MPMLHPSSRPRERAWLVGTLAVATGAVAFAVLGVGLADATAGAVDAALSEAPTLCALALPR
jgi:hypothetical protein